MAQVRLGFVVLLLSAALSPTASQAQDFDPSPAWPLCGRIAAAPPAGWAETDGCPSDRWGNSSFMDLPIASPFGSRPLASENDRYDFHRGLDIATPEGTPVFAIADGIVKIAGDHSSYSDPLVQLRHYRPGESSCGTVGCYNSNYMHLSQALVVVDATVNKGDLIGHTGSSASGFAHLHFETRNAPGFDPSSRWQRDCIHPVGVLPYTSTAVPTITFDSVDTLNPNNPIVQLTVNTSRVDIERIELTLFDAAGDPITQPGNTPDAKGYNVLPSWFGMNEWNFQYSHKNSTNFPWESFGAGGANECPYHADHPTSYSAHVHLDRQLALDPLVGEFNGVEIRPTKYSEGNYNLNLTFQQLVGAAACLEAKVYQASGGTATAEWGDCSGSGDPPAYTDSLISGETLFGGTQQGSYADTWTQNEGAVEVFTERESGGRPKNRYSFVDHEWTVDIGAGGSIVTVWVDAWTAPSADGDTFELTATGSSDVLVLDKTSDNDTYQTLALPPGSAGILSLRLRDTDQSTGARSLDSVTIDHLFVRVESPTNLDPPATPTGASAAALSASSAEVTWSHIGDTESGFKVDRQTQNANLSWGAWTEAGMAAVDAVSFTDSGLLSQATYRYRVAATNAAGDSAWVESGEITTPLGLTAAAAGYKQKGWQYVDVSWSGAPAGFVDIFRDDGSGAVLVGLPAAGPSGNGVFTDGLIAKGGAQYVYQVCAAGDAANCSLAITVGF